MEKERLTHKWTFNETSFEILADPVDSFMETL